MQIQGNTVRERLLSVIKAQKIRFPGARIADKTGYDKATVSEYLRNKDPSEAFIRTFCEEFGVDFDQIWKGPLPSGEENKEIQAVNGQAHFTPDQLFAMFLHVTEAQTAILDKIKGDTGKVVATTENLWNGLQALAMRQGGDREILLNSLARLEGKGENELIAEANRKITELALSAARQDKSDEVRSSHTESKGP